MNLPHLSFIEKQFTSHSQKTIQRWLEYRRETISIGVNIGCGKHPIEGLVNVDKYSDLADMNIEAKELRSAFPNKVDHVEAHHVIEHLSFSEAEEFGKLCFDILDDNRGGTLIITCPHLTRVMWRYFASEYLPHKLRGQDYILKMLYGSQENEGMFHRSGFTPRIIANIFRNAGFESVFTYAPFPERATPSLCVIGLKRGK